MNSVELDIASDQFKPEVLCPSCSLIRVTGTESVLVVVPCQFPVKPARYIAISIWSSRRWKSLELTLAWEQRGLQSRSPPRNLSFDSIHRLTYLLFRQVTLTFALVNNYTQNQIVGKRTYLHVIRKLQLMYILIYDKILLCLQRLCNCGIVGKEIKLLKALSSLLYKSKSSGNRDQTNFWVKFAHIETHSRLQESGTYLLHKWSYSQFCFQIPKLS